MGGGTLAPSVEQRVGQGFGMGRGILLGPKVWRPERAGFLLLLLLLLGSFVVVVVVCLTFVLVSKPRSPGSIPVAESLIPLFFPFPRGQNLPSRPLNLLPLDCFY